LVNLRFFSDSRRINKANFFATEVYSPLTNDVIKIPTTSTIYNVEQFGLILEKIMSFYYENFDWVIPPPDVSLTSAD